MGERDLDLDALRCPLRSGDLDADRRELRDAERRSDLRDAERRADLCDAERERDLERLRSLHRDSAQRGNTDFIMATTTEHFRVHYVRIEIGSKTVK